MSKAVSVPDLKRMKQRGELIVAVTAYDYSTAVLLDQVNVDLILVGDSLATVMLGHPNTLPVNMEEMLHHTRAVARGVQRAMVVADLPFMSYYTVEAALENAGRFLKEARAAAVKLEGGKPPQLAAVTALVAQGIPVVAHLGFTPQSIHALGGYYVQGKSLESAKQLQAEAELLAKAGACALVLELVPPTLAAAISSDLEIPTIGIGAGPYCDGQIQVFHDLVGLGADYVPKHAARYAELRREICQAVERYAADVRARRFPEAEVMT
ncbi:MAG: 3-methyl-2-oxobutanoate hydroxymethyltransferase [Cyanobacteria bacterium NC_groundwater_1444_Ag_S-0.65um_54_12]|nr:3-methyl-2-oxobutanoate hydroxymethyltransferase [Cyanobacteria bacterium NC_groundwater_1444_Ag_S-0.65um_54_12]